MKRFGKNWIVVSKLAQKNWFFSSLRKRSKFQIFFVLSKKQIAWTKTFNSSLILWHWRVMKSLGKNWIAVSKSAQDKLVTFFSQQVKRVKISTFTGLFCLKGKLLEPKNFIGVWFCDTEEPWKVWAKTEPWFPNQPPKNWWISFQQATREEFSNFIGLFCLKDKFLEQKTLAVVSFCDTEGPWKVCAKTELWFPIQPKKKKNKGLIFLQQEGRVEFSNFIGLFCLKGKLLEQKTFKRISFYDTEGIWNVWPKTELWFLNQTPENKPSHLLETNSPIFWENDLETTSFCPNFSWPFNVTKWSILVQAIYFSTKQTNKIWKLDPSRQRNAENVETF